MCKVFRLPSALPKEVRMHSLNQIESLSYWMTLMLSWIGLFLSTYRHCLAKAESHWVCKQKTITDNLTDENLFQQKHRTRRFSTALGFLHPQGFGAFTLQRREACCFIHSGALLLADTEGKAAPGPRSLTWLPTRFLSLPNICWEPQFLTTWISLQVPRCLHSVLAEHSRLNCLREIVFCPHRTKL